MEESTCHCGKRFIKSKVSQQCFRCDDYEKQTEQLLYEYDISRVMLYLTCLINAPKI